MADHPKSKRPSDGLPQPFMPPQPGAKKAKGGNQGKKGSAKEVSDRIYQTAQLLVKRIPKHQIKRALKDKYDLGYRQAENYIARARDFLIEQTNRPKTEHFAEAFATYESIIRNPESSVSDVMRAQDALCSLLGLYAPTKIAPTTPDGKEPYKPVIEIVKDLTDDELAVLRKLKHRSSTIAAGETDPN